MNILFLLFSLFASFLHTAPTSSTLDDALVAYYSFDNCDARDDTGNGSDGFLYGSVECWCGIKDDGLLFDGIHDFVIFEGPVNRYFNTSDFTVSFYIKPGHYSPFPESLLSKRTNCSTQFMMDFNLNLQKGKVAIDLLQSSSIFYPNLSTNIDSTSWQHIVLVREGTRAFTYINGNLRQESFRCSGVDISNDTPLSFSNSPCLYIENRRFKGILDELRVYKKALTPQEVEMLFNQFPIERDDQDCFS